MDSRGEGQGLAADASYDKTHWFERQAQGASAGGSRNRTLHRIQHLKYAEPECAPVVDNLARKAPGTLTA